MPPSRGGHKDLIALVIIGRDFNVKKDFSESICDICERYDIEYSDRIYGSVSLENPERLIAVAAGWRWLINESFYQIIVLHDSLLPRYRGFNPMVTALLNRDPEIGVTAIIANKDFDCGDIIDSRAVAVRYPIKIAEAIRMVSILYFDIAQSLLSKLSDSGRLEGSPQDEASASYSVWRDEEDYKIDWAGSADFIVHFINCFSFPFKGASTVCDNQLLHILEADTEPDVNVANRDVGKVIFLTRYGKPVVICGRGLLRIDLAVDDDGNSVLPLKKFRSRLK